MHKKVASDLYRTPIRLENNVSLYGDYIKEAKRDEIIETEYGFATYRYIAPDSVYIIDIYVVPEFRRSKKTGALVDMVVESAKSRGCKKLIGTVVTAAVGSTVSLRLLLSHGMHLVSSNNEFIVFEKDI